MVCYILNSIIDNKILKKCSSTKTSLKFSTHLKSFIKISKNQIYLILNVHSHNHISHIILFIFDFVPFISWFMTLFSKSKCNQQVTFARKRKEIFTIWYMKYLKVRRINPEDVSSITKSLSLSQFFNDKICLCIQIAIIFKDHMTVLYIWG